MRHAWGGIAVLMLAGLAWGDPPNSQTSTPAGDSGAEVAADPATRDYLSANGLLNRGLYELAAAEYRTFLSHHPDHPKAAVARYGLGVSLFRMGKHADAATELKPLDGLPGFQYAAEAATVSGQCHLAERRFTQAAETFKKVLENHGSHELADDAAAGLVEALYLDNRHEAAATEAQSFAARWPESPLRERAEFFGALATMAGQDYPAAAKRFEDLLARYPGGPFAEQASLLLAQCHQQGNALQKAAAQYRDVLKQAGNRYIPDALFGLAVLLAHQGQAGEAGALLDQLLERFPESPLIPTARMQRGRAYFDEGKFDPAFRMFQQVVDGKREPTDEAAYWMAKCRLRQGDFTDAARRLDRAARDFPQSNLLPEMLYDRAIALLRAGQLDDTAQALKECLSRFPEHALAPNALHLLATTEHQRRRFDESQSYCREFLGKYPSHELAAPVAFLQAENDFLSERYEQAAEGCRRFLQRYAQDPAAPTARYRLGSALYRLERFDEAKSLLVEVAGEAPADEAFRPALLYMGDICFQRGEWREAEKYFGGYISFGLEMPAADDALLKLGLSLQRQGSSEQALQAYDRLLSRFETSRHRLQALFERGQALVALERFDQAAEAFNAVVREGADSRFTPYALSHLASIAMRRGDSAEAASLFDRAAQAAPQKDLQTDALYQSAQALMAAGRFPEAEAAFSRFMERYPQDPRWVEAEARQAIARSRQNRHTEAIAAIEQVLARPEVKLDPSLHSALQYERAWCLRETGKTAEAAEAYRALLDGGSAGELGSHALLELSALEIEARRFQQAAELLQRLRKAIRESAPGTTPQTREQCAYRLGICEFELGHYSQTVELFDELLRDFPDSALAPSAAFYCGEALFRQGDHERARKYLAQAAKSESDPAFAPALLRLGDSLAALQQWAESERVFAGYLDRFPDSPHWFQARFGIGWARENQKRYDEAVSAYREVTARHQGPTAARAQFQIGECLFARNRHEEALRELLKVDILYAYPEWSAAALYEAGRCFEMLGKTGEARTQYKQVAEQYRETQWARLAAQRLTEVSAASLPGR